MIKSQTRSGMEGLGLLVIKYIDHNYLNDLNSNRFSKENINYVCEKYHEKTSKELAKELGVSHQWVLKQWMIAGLSGKKNVTYHHDDNYFKKVDTPNKAYVIGLIASDGNVYKRKNSENRQGWVRISLKSNDIKILKDIAIDMKSNKPVLTCNGRVTETAELSIVSNNILEQLDIIGIRQRKTWDMSINEIIKNIPKEFLSDFIRGYFDGDGSIYINKDKIPSMASVTISMPESNGLQLCNFLREEVGIKVGFCLDKRMYKRSFGYMFCSNIESRYLFIKYIYKNVESGKSNLFLERKFELAKDFINSVNEKKQKGLKVKDVVQHLTAL